MRSSKVAEWRLGVSGGRWRGGGDGYFRFRLGIITERRLGTMDDRRGSVTSGSGEVVVHDDVGKWLTRGALSVPRTGMHMICTCDARCCPSMHKTAAVAKPDG